MPLRRKRIALLGAVYAGAVLARERARSLAERDEAERVREEAGRRLQEVLIDGDRRRGPDPSYAGLERRRVGCH